MWQIIKAEIHYYRNIYISIYSLVVLFLIINMYWVKDNGFILTMLFFALPLLGITIGSEEGKTKRNRFYASLPISVKNIGYAKQPLWIFFWVIIMGLFLCSKLINIQYQLQTADIWITLSLTGAILIIGSGMQIVHDLTYCIHSTKKRYFLKLPFIMIVGAAFMFYFYVTSNGDSFKPVSLGLKEILLSPPASIFTMGFGLSLTLLSYFCFVKRRSFLD